MIESRQTRHFKPTSIICNITQNTYLIYSRPLNGLVLLGFFTSPIIACSCLRGSTQWSTVLMYGHTIEEQLVIDVHS